MFLLPGRIFARSSFAVSNVLTHAGFEQLGPDFNWLYIHCPLTPTTGWRDLSRIRPIGFCTDKRICYILSTIQIMCGQPEMPNCVTGQRLAGVIVGTGHSNAGNQSGLIRRTNLIWVCLCGGTPECSVLWYSSTAGLPLDITPPFREKGETPKRIVVTGRRYHSLSRLVLRRSVRTLMSAPEHVTNAQQAFSKRCEDCWDSVFG